MSVGENCGDAMYNTELIHRQQLTNARYATADLKLRATILITSNQKLNPLHFQPISLGILLSDLKFRSSSLYTWNLLRPLPQEFLQGNLDSHHLRDRVVKNGLAYMMLFAIHQRHYWNPLARKTNTFDSQLIVDFKVLHTIGLHGKNKFRKYISF